MCSVKVGPVVGDINLLDTHALLRALDAEFENERGKLLHTRIKPDDVEDIAEYHDLYITPGQFFARIADTKRFQQTCIAS